MKIGFIGFGEINTPREMIETKAADALNRLQKKGLDMIDCGIVTDDVERLESAAAIKRIGCQPLDALVLCIAGWIPSYAVIRTIDPYKHLPMVLWGLCGSSESGHLVTTAEQAGTSALRHPMEELGFCFKYVYDTTDGRRGDEAMLQYLQVIAARRRLLTAKTLTVGYRDMNLYGTMFDGVSLKRQTGIEAESMEMLELVRNADNADAEEAGRLLTKIRAEWQFDGDADDQVLLRGIQYYLALRDVIAARGYKGVTINDVDGMKKLEGFPPAMVFMLLAQELGVCTVPENDVMGSATQLIANALTGQIGMYLEFYEYMRDRVLMGVPDYVPAQVVEGGVKVMTTKFGLLDSCVLNVSAIKTGTVTMARLFAGGSGYGMHLALAEAQSPRRWEEAGWTPPAPQLPSLELVLGERTEAFTDRVMSQHYIITYGDNIALFEEYCRMSGIDVIKA